MLVRAKLTIQCKNMPTFRVRVSTARSATIPDPRRLFGSSVPTVREFVTDSSGVGLKWNIIRFGIIKEQVINCCV